MNCPYARGICNYDNAVNMVGHYDKRIQFDSRISIRQFVPRLARNLADFIQPHLCIHDLAKYTFPVLCANRDEIRAGG